MRNKNVITAAQLIQAIQSAKYRAKLIVQGLDPSIIDFGLNGGFNWYFDQYGRLFAIAHDIIYPCCVIEGDSLLDQSKEGLLAAIDNLKPEVFEFLCEKEWIELDTEDWKAYANSYEMCWIDGVGFVKPDLSFFQVIRKRVLKAIGKMAVSSMRLSEYDMEVIHHNEMPMVFSRKGELLGSYGYYGRSGFVFFSQHEHAICDVYEFAKTQLWILYRIIESLSTDEKESMGISSEIRNDDRAHQTTE